MMKFQNYDELLKYLADKNLPDLEFTITEVGNGQCPIDSVCSKNATEPNKTIDFSFTALTGNPSMQFTEGEENIWVVEDYEHIPNACSASYITVFGRRISTPICDDGNGNAKVTMIGEANGKKYVTDFILKRQTENFENTIKLHD